VKKWRPPELVQTIGLFLIGVAFIVSSIFLGIEAKWDPFYDIVTTRGHHVAWFIVGAGFVIGIGSVVGGAFGTLWELRKRRTGGRG
jgi:hypothetical protein